MDQTINVNITPGQFRPSLHYSQGDVGRVFKIQVVDFDIPANSTVQCVATKPSGLGFTLAGTVSGNEITFVTTDAVTDEWGRFPAEVKIINGGNVIGTANFLMIGEKNPHPDSTIDGKQEEFIPLLTLLVERIEAAAEDVDAQVPVVQQAADDAAASAAAASDSADSAADSATSASGSANEASNSAIDAAASASSAATSAEDAKESAEAFVGENYIEDENPYHFRQTGNGAEGVGTREKLKAVVGGTIAWNQLQQASVSISAVAGLTIGRDGEYLTAVGTSEETATRDIYPSAGTIPANHVVLICSDGTGNIRMGRAGFNVATDKNYFFHKHSSSFYCSIRLYFEANTAYNVKRRFNIIDVTALFPNDTSIADYIYSLEQSTAGAGIAYLRNLLPEAYYPYDEGSLKSVEGLESHDTVGLNAWDEEWRNGFYNATTGVFVSSINYIANKNPIRVIPNSRYYMNSPSNIVVGAFFYDENGNFVTRMGLTTWAPSVFNIPEGCYYMNFYIDTPYGTTYNHDICINISDAAKNGQYEPYIKRTYPLDSTLTLRGLFVSDSNNQLRANGDIYSPNGEVVRKYGIIDLSSVQNWSVSSYNPSQHNCEIANIKQNTDNIISAKYINDPANRASASSMTDGHMVVSNNRIYITSGEGVNPSGLLVYELATPTTESADPYAELQICDPLGTEAFVTDGIVPVGNVTQYPEDLKAKLEGLPWNFSTLIAQTEATSTASRAYAIGDYLILNNVLYKVTASIASGGTITVGTNVVATTVTDEIKALRS